MKQFDEIEKKHGSSPVVTDDPLHAGSGTLILDGEKSQAVLLSDDTLLGNADEDGWFELRLKGPNGKPILLHNAILTRSAQHINQNSRRWEEHIYPNAVILGSDALAAGNKVPEIAFTIRNLGLFFHHQHVESHYLDGKNPELNNAIKDLRKKDQGSYDIFNPIELFVVHKFPRVMSFKVAGHRYEVFVGSQISGLGWKKIDFRTDPIATIRFASPVEIEEAMDLAWQWKRFFGTLALRPMPWTSLTARSGNALQMREAEFYLPNHASDAVDLESPFSLWLGNIPLNRWNERKALADLMQSWIEREGARYRLRSAIQSASRNFRQGNSVDDVVTLCAGIESLEELKGQSALSPEQAKVIADGAIGAAKASGIQIEDARLRGIIGSLKNQSLGERLKLMLATLEPAISNTQARTLISAVKELRQVAAHGLSPAADVMPKATPTVEALACVCALYDLVTCGMPIEGAPGQRVGLLSHAVRSIYELELIKRRTKC